MPLSGTAFGFDFDPVADRIRIVGNTGQNMRLNPDTGAVVDSDANSPGTQPDTSLNPPGNVVEIAYTNKVAGAGSTTLYGIDSAGDMFVQIGGTNGSPPAGGGAVTPVTALGNDTSDQVGFDISPDANTGFAALTVGGMPQLIRISLATGPSPVGIIGDGSVGIRGLAVVIPPPAPIPTNPPPTTDSLFAVTKTNDLLRFSSASPGTIISNRSIGGLQPGENVLGIDVRPASGQLYALGSTSRLYTINPATGAATQVGTGAFAVPLNGTSFGFSFDPVADRIRVVSDTSLNMRLDPNTGAVVDSNPNLPGTQPDSFLTATYTVGLAHTNPIAGATSSTLFGIDGANDWLVRLGGPGGSPSPNLGQITMIGPLGVDIDWAAIPAAPFDITVGGIQRQ